MSLKDLLIKPMENGKFWTHSLTLVSGCTKVSPGCLNCWSESMHKRFQKIPFDLVRTHDLRIVDILPHPSGPRRKQRVWTYWNDLFHESVDAVFLSDFFATIAGSEDYHIICTKRPHKTLEYLSKWEECKGFPNLIILVSVEDQQRVYERISDFGRLAIRGWRVGLLVEPMLGPIDFRDNPAALFASWIICGPENGKGKRPFEEQWAMRLQAQAKAAGIPFFYKAGLLNGKRYIETP